jgi:hypothetical protein
MGFTALHCAAAKGRLSLCGMMLQHVEIDANAVTNKGDTALHIAARFCEDSTSYAGFCDLFRSCSHFTSHDARNEDGLTAAKLRAFLLKPCWEEEDRNSWVPYFDLLTEDLEVAAACNGLDPKEMLQAQDVFMSSRFSSQEAREKTRAKARMRHQNVDRKRSRGAHEGHVKIASGRRSRHQAASGRKKAEMGRDLLSFGFYVLETDATHTTGT